MKSQRMAERTAASSIRPQISSMPPPSSVVVPKNCVPYSLGMKIMNLPMRSPTRGCLYDTPTGLALGVERVTTVLAIVHFLVHLYEAKAIEIMWGRHIRLKLGRKSQKARALKRAHRDRTPLARISVLAAFDTHENKVPRDCRQRCSCPYTGTRRLCLIFHFSTFLAVVC